jgi:hypothetical protein
MSQIPTMGWRAPQELRRGARLKTLVAASDRLFAKDIHLSGRDPRAISVLFEHAGDPEFASQHVDENTGVLERGLEERL